MLRPGLWSSARVRRHSGDLCGSLLSNTGGFPCNLNPLFARGQEGTGTGFLFERKELPSAFWHNTLHLNLFPQWHQDHQAHQMAMPLLPLPREPPRSMLPASSVSVMGSLPQGSEALRTEHFCFSVLAEFAKSPLQGLMKQYVLTPPPTHNRSFFVLSMYEVISDIEILNCYEAKLAS